MAKLLQVLLIHLVPLTIVYGQEATKKIVNLNDKIKTKEIFFVKESNDSIKHGSYIYKSKGYVQAKGQYINNKKEGPWIYRCDYEFKLKGEYRNDLREGKWVFKYKKDTISVLEFRNDLLHGTQIGYYPNGRICVVKKYKLGLKEGIEIHYYKNGNIKEIKNYTNGLLNGACSLYADDEQLISTIEFINETPVNLNIEIDVKSNAKLKENLIKYYSGDLKNGNGNLVVMVKGLRTSLFIPYLKCSVKDSLLNGDLTDYWINSEKRITGKFKDGYRVDKWQYYNLDGNLISEKEYLFSKKTKTDTSFGANYDFEPFSRYDKIMAFSPVSDSYFVTPNSYHYDYPRECRVDSVEGAVMVKFELTEFGDMENLTIYKSVHPLLDEEAIRIVKTKRFRLPAMCEGLPERVSYLILVDFSIK